MLDELVKQFKELRITVTNRKHTRAEAETLLERLNHQFPRLLDDWDVLDAEAQKEARSAFVSAQSDFHYSANVLLIEVAGPLPTNQLRFGEFPENPPVTDSMNASAAVTTVTNNQATTASSGTEPQNICSNGNEPMQTDQVSETISEMAKKIRDDSPMPHLNSISKEQCPPKTANEEEMSASFNAEEQETNQSRELVQLSYQEQADLLRPVLGLPPMTQVNEATLDGFLKIISKVNENAERKNVIFSKMIERLIVLQIVASIDTHSQECWGFCLQFSEPSLQRLANFLADRIKNVKQRDLTNPPKPMEFKIPKKDLRSPSLHGKSKKQIRSERSNTPSPGPSTNKRIRNGPNAICPMCTQGHTLRLCPQFLKLSLEAREAEVYRRKLCINCFSNRHITAQCEDGVCKICESRHNSLLHHRSKRN